MARALLVLIADSLRIHGSITGGTAVAALVRLGADDVPAALGAGPPRAWPRT